VSDASGRATADLAAHTETAARIARRHATESCTHRVGTTTACSIACQQEKCCSTPETCGNSSITSQRTPRPNLTLHAFRNSRAADGEQTSAAHRRHPDRARNLRAHDQQQHQTHDRDDRPNPPRRCRTTHNVAEISRAAFEVRKCVLLRRPVPHRRGATSVGLSQIRNTGCLVGKRNASALGRVSPHTRRR
jgi:hypothetical protein